MGFSDSGPPSPPSEVFRKFINFGPRNHLLERKLNGFEFLIISIEIKVEMNGSIIVKQVETDDHRETFEEEVGLL